MNDRQTNRERFPECSKIIDAFRQAFGQDQVKVLWVQENGHETGSRAILQKPPETQHQQIPP